MLPWIRYRQQYKSTKLDKLFFSWTFLQFDFRFPSQLVAFFLYASFSYFPSARPYIEDIRLINGANCFMTQLAWCWQGNKTEWGGLGEAITLPIVIKKRRTRLCERTMKVLGHGERPSGTAHSYKPLKSTCPYTHRCMSPM